MIVSLTLSMFSAVLYCTWLGDDQIRLIFLASWSVCHMISTIIWNKALDRIEKLEDALSKKEK